MSQIAKNVLAVGRCTLDYIGVVERMSEGEVRSELEQFSIQGGGTAATAIAILSRWGIGAKFVGKVGDDRRGEHILSTLRGEGVDVSDVVIVEDGISQCDYTIVEERTARTRSYFTQGTISPMSVEEVERRWLDKQDILLVDGSCPEAQLVLMQEAKARGVTTVLDAYVPNAAIEALVPWADYLIAGERFISRLTGEGALQNMLASSLEMGPSVAVITLGNEGCIAMTKGDAQSVRVAAYDVDVVDRTGAGDIYHGAFLYAMCQQWSLQQCLAFANVAAAHCCAQIGGRGSLPTPEALLALVV